MIGRVRFGRGGRAFRLVASTLVGVVVVVSCGSSGSQTKGHTSAGGGSFGSIPDVCHPATTPNKSVSERGISDNLIHITAMSDANNQIHKGLNQELIDASNVFVKWCNAQGGINGRKIVLSIGDAQLTLYAQAISTACNNAFALVGGGGVLDDQGQKQRSECKLPAFPGLVTSVQARNSDLMFQAVPLSVTQITSGLLGYVSKKYPDSLKQIGYVTGNLPSLQFFKNQIRLTGQQQFHWSTQAAYWSDYNSVVAPAWLETAQNIARAGVKGLVFIGEPKDLAGLLVSLRSISYKGLEWVYSLGNAYDPMLVKDGGAALDSTNVYMTLSAAPFEKASSVPAVAQYLKLFDQYNPQGKSHTLLGLQSFAAWLYFAKAANACGAKLDRACLVREAGKVHEFDGAGLTVPSDPAAAAKTGAVSDCYTAARATSKGFEVVDVKPNRGVFNCSPDNVWTIKQFEPK